MSSSKSNADLSIATRLAIASRLLELADHLALPRGAITSVTKANLCSVQTVSRIWNAVVDNSGTDNLLSALMPKREGNCGRKRVPRDLGTAIKTIPYRQRRNMRSVAAALGVSKLAVVRAIKRGEIKRETNTLKPYLTDENKLKRLGFCLDFIDPISYVFDAIEHRIYIDEK